MSASRLLMLTLVFAFGCKQLFSSSLAEDSSKQALPHLYDKDYGTLEYTDSYTKTKLAASWGIEESQSVVNTFWAQEAVGTPEARALLAEMRKEGFAFSSPKLAIADNGFDLRQENYSRFNQELNWTTGFTIHVQGDGMHGTKTLGIIVGEHPVGVSTHGVVHELSNSATKLALVLAEGRKSADVVNVSLVHPDANVPKVTSDWLVSNIKELPATTLWVNSAGNDFPYPLDDTNQQIKNKAILVGSADPSGFPSYFSQADEGIVVLAPSDSYLQSIDADGKLVNYGGTSGAAPMVSGVLADVKAILPNITRDEAAALLRVTATRTSINSVSKVNGAGMLNHYKMLRVAQRIADLLQQDSTATISSLLQEPKVTRFHDETAKLYLEAKQAFSSQNHDEMFKKLRQAFFLTDSQDELQQGIRTQLADFYRRAGQPASAEFYRMPTTADEWKVNVEKYLKTMRSKGDKIKVSLDDSEVMATKLSYRSLETYRDYVRQEINNLRAWIRNTKGVAELKAISWKLIRLNNTKFFKLSKIENGLALSFHSEMGRYKKAAVRNILFDAAADKKFTNKDIKLMLEYASVTFDDLNPQEIQRLKIVCTKRIKNGSKSIDSMDSLIKAIF